MVSQVNDSQSPGQPQNGSAQGRWQQGLMNSGVIGEATSALISKEVNNFDFVGPYD
jgi:hypothetical protein